VLGGLRDNSQFLVDVINWPGGQRRTLATTDGHGNFVHALH
jgi:hypothetical protein